MLNAIVPVKSTSERVPNKNFRDFHNGKSLLDILLNKLKSIKDIDKIYVSSDKNLSEYCDDRGAIFIERNKTFCNNITPWSQVICEVIKSIPCEQNDTLMWCHVTGPLFNRYEEGIKKAPKKVPTRYKKSTKKVSRRYQKVSKRYQEGIKKAPRKVSARYTECIKKVPKVTKRYEKGTKKVPRRYQSGTKKV